MDCPEYNELLAFVERRCNDEMREQTQEHIDHCPACFGAVVELAESLSPDSGISPALDETAAASDVPKVSVRSALDSTRPGGGGGGLSLPLARTEVVLGAPGTNFDHFRVIRTLD